ncbi:AbrB family looped-hinge helix DNA binding protein [Ureibacillus xyleni]|uniref:AbrB family looped-hinge helix DNA binding protein n=1 Tax=Ureibacillus xyleni TaxID=614648 RepID=A0A285TPZ8_9BACL|nr:AbrB/MazE/SpoVT family DNA-binding domain-containing protein [Ureibacillus xyleni]SOC25350.1 AbrB family looped-hinge helix DNA binding protein [Ureibacillus xyleni]
MDTPKKIKVSKQRQMTIPKEFFDALQMQDEVTVELVEGGILIKPIHKLPDGFVEQILQSLVEKGFSGQELVEKFKEATQSVGWTTFRATDEENTI